MSELPYPGLRAFHRDETDIFFGREEQTDDLLERLERSRFLAVIGPSGCGKSSLVRTGLIASLRTGFLASAGANWRIAEMRPRGLPMTNLAAALLERSALGGMLSQEEEPARRMPFWRAILQRGPLGVKELLDQNPLPKGTNLLLVVDQFEEIFRYREVADSDEADAFIALLLGTARQQKWPVYVVITMRSDFIGNCSLFPGLPEAVNDGQYLTPRLTREQLREAIEGPAAVFGGSIQPALTNRLLNDTGNNQDRLPVLQHALMRMWMIALKDTESAPALELATYQQVGGLKEALSLHADEAYGELTDEQQEICRKLFCQLTERRNRLDTRRPVKLGAVAKVCGVDTEDVAEVVEVFRRPDRSFLMPPASEVPDLRSSTLLDISHESLIRQWQRLNGWVEEEAHSAEEYRRLADTARLWHRGAAALWGTPNLELALQWRDEQHPNSAWAERYGGDFSLATKFLDASVREQQELRDAKEREQAERLHKKLAEENRERELAAARRLARTQRHSANRLKIGIAVTSILVTVASVGWFWARLNYVKAQIAANSATANHLQAQAQEYLVDKLSTALLVTLESIRANDSAQQERTRRIIRMMGDTQDDRRKLTARLVDALEFDPRLTQFLRGHSERVSAVAFSRDGRFLASGSEDDTIIVRDLELGSGSNSEMMLDAGNESVYAIAMHPNRSAVASGGKNRKVRLLDLESGDARTLYEHKDRVNALAFSPDGKTLASGGSDKTIIVYDLERGARLHTIEEAHSDGVTGLTFNHDGSILASGSWDKRVKLWDISGERPESRQLPPGHTDAVLSVAFHPGRNTLASAGKDGLVMLWDADGVNLQGVLVGHTGRVMSIAFGSNGSTLVSGGEDRRIRIWDVEDPTSWKLLDELSGHSDWVRTVAFRGDGSGLASGGGDSVTGDSVILWDLDKQWRLGATIFDSGIQQPDYGDNDEGEGTGITSGTFDPIQGALALATKQEVRLWNYRDGPQLTRSLQRDTNSVDTSSVRTLALSDSGRYLVAGEVEEFDNGESRYELLLWDLTKADDSGRRLDAFKGSVRKLPHAPAAAFSPDGQFLAGSVGKACDTDPDKTEITILELATGDSSGHSTCVDLDEAGKSDDIDQVQSLTFSPDGQQLAIGTTEKKIVIWNLERRLIEKTLQKTLPGEAWASVMNMAFSPDGTKLAAGSNDTTVTIWDLRVKEPIHVLTEHRDWIQSLSFSPDGATVASGSKDSMVILWNVATGEMLARFTGQHMGPIHTVAFHNDRELQSAGTSGNVIQWDVDPDAWKERACGLAGRNLTQQEWEQFMGKDRKYVRTCPDLPAADEDRSLAVGTTRNEAPAHEPGQTG